MVTSADVEGAFSEYLAEMDRCRQAGHVWALLHIVVLMPDFCGALENRNATAKRGQYKSWCKRYLAPGTLTPAERYGMRCTLLHTGRTKPEATHGSRYVNYEFHSEANCALHGKEAPRNVLHLDVPILHDETVAGLRQWFSEVAAGNPKTKYVEKHLHLMSRARPFVALAPAPSVSASSCPPGVVVTNVTSS